MAHLAIHQQTDGIETTNSEIGVLWTPFAIETSQLTNFTDSCLGCHKGTYKKGGWWGKARMEME